MIYDSEEQRLDELGECADYFMRLWNERVNVEPRSDLISMMAHSDATLGAGARPDHPISGSRACIAAVGSDED